MGTMPPDDASVEPTPGVDFTSLRLTQREGYMLSRALYGKQPVRDLLASTGLPLVEARAVLVELLGKGVLQVEGAVAATNGAAGRREPGEATRGHDGTRLPPSSVPGGSSAPPKTNAGAGPAPPSFDDIVFSPADLAEPCDLSLEQKKRILYVESRLGRWSHYALLELKRTAGPGDIKRGYFKASKEFHPDAYFRKQLGSYKDRTERIFRAMKQAYDVLSDAEGRQKYDETLGFDFSPEELAELKVRAEEQRRANEERRAREAEVERAAHRDDRLQQRLKARRLKRNPLLDRLKKARELCALAEESSRAGRAIDASRHARLAREYAPQDSEIATRAAPLIRLGNLARARELLKRAEGALDAGDASAATDLADEAADLAEGDGALLTAVARALKRSGAPRRALRHAKAATEAAHGLADAWLVLYELCEQEEQWHVALRAAERLAELRPTDKVAKERVKQARRQAR